MPLTSNQILEALAHTDGLPVSRITPRRMIYEAGDRNGKVTGQFFIDYASYPGGTTEEVPRYLIDRLERDGLIVRAFKHDPGCDAWTLPANYQPTPVLNKGDSE